MPGLNNNHDYADQLQTATERSSYGEAAHLVEAVHQLSAHFQGYASIPKVAELNGRTNGLQMSLQVRSSSSHVSWPRVALQNK